MRIASGESLADLGLSQDDDPDQRRCPAVPDHHRGPGQRLPARHRHDHRLPHRRRRGRTAGRRHGRHRRRDQRPLRLDAGQADLPRPYLRGGRGPGPAGARRVPDPRGQHQHPVPASRPGGSGVRRRERLDGVHRAAARAADHPRAGRPRHPAAALAGRGDGQQAVRAIRRPCSTRGSSGRPASTSPSPRRRAPGSGCSISGPEGFAADLRLAGRGRGHRHHLPGRAPVAARDPGPDQGSAPDRAVRGADDHRSCSRSSAGAGRPTTSRCGSSPRTRGSGWTRCATTCRGSACRCCCGVGTRWATRRTRPR